MIHIISLRSSSGYKVHEVGALFPLLMPVTGTRQYILMTLIVCAAVLPNTAAQSEPSGNVQVSVRAEPIVSCVVLISGKIKIARGKRQCRATV